MDSDKGMVPAGRRSRAEIGSYLHKFQNSNLTVHAFCEQHGLNKGTFNTWKKRYLKSEKQKSDAGSFLRLAVNSSMSVPELFAEVRGIRIYQPVNASFLKSLLA